MSAAEVRAALERHGLAPHVDRGQNFLIDPVIARRLTEAAGVRPEDRVIEIGPGLGMLTRALAAAADRVWAVEVDAGLVRALEAEGLPDNVTLVHRDARELDLAEAARALGGSVRVVANLPYSVATPLLRRLLDARGFLAGWALMLQREVARRIGAETGSRDYGSLAVLHALCVEAESALDLRPGCFYPVPAVTSSFLRFTPRRDAEPTEAGLASVEALARGAFRYRRKKVANALLRAGFRREDVLAALSDAGIDPGLRPAAIPPEAWWQLARVWMRDRLWIPGQAADEGGDA